VAGKEDNVHARHEIDILFPNNEFNIRNDVCTEKANMSGSIY